MPFTYSIDPPQKLVVISLFGETKGTIYLEATRAFLADPLWQPGFDRLWDGRQVTLIDVGPDEVQAYVRLAIDEIEKLREGRSALVFTREAGLTISHLFRFMLPWEVMVFEEIEEALAWLGSPAPRVRA